MKAPTARILFAFLAVFLLFASQCFAAHRENVPAGLGDGPGVWANIWNYPQGDVDAFCSHLRAYGVRNFFIQTSRSNMPAVAHPTELGQLIDACHRHKIRVIGWAYLELTNPGADAEKMLAAAHFTSPHGESLDAIAPDLEKNLTVERVEKFSQKLREELGPNYPLIACVYSPLNHYSEVSHIPWHALAQYYDVIAPMSYWNSKYQKLDAYDYTVATVRTIRELTGRPDIEIHVIGDAMGSSAGAIQQFMRACQRAEATSCSIYPNQRATTEQLAALSRYPDYFHPNSRFRLAAFREMLRTGALQMPANADPTQAISRADFYKMIARYAHTPVPAVEASASPIYADEALSTLAHIVDVQPSAKGKRRADRWFAAPAMAESQQPKRHSDRPLDYMDAALMVLEASSALGR